MCYPSMVGLLDPWNLHLYLAVNAFGLVLVSLFCGVKVYRYHFGCIRVSGLQHCFECSSLGAYDHGNRLGNCAKLGVKLGSDFGPNPHDSTRKSCGSSHENRVSGAGRVEKSDTHMRKWFPSFFQVFWFPFTRTSYWESLCRFGSSKTYLGTSEGGG